MGNDTGSGGGKRNKLIQSMPKSPKADAKKTESFELEFLSRNKSPTKDGELKETARFQPYQNSQTVN